MGGFSQELNSIIGGAHKDSSQWQTVWRDLKHKVSKSVSEIRTEQQRSTGNMERKYPPLAPYESRVAGIIGLGYVQGSSTCPESIPETGVQLERLEQGDESVLDEDPRVVTISLGDIQMNEEVKDLYVLDDVLEVIDIEAKITLPVEADGAGPSNRVTPSSEGCTPRLRKNLVKKTRKASRVPIGSQLQEARTSFQDLCASNNKGIEMLSQATMNQAEAASVHAQAALLHAQNETERIQIFIKLTDVLESAIKKIK